MADEVGANDESLGEALWLVLDLVREFRAEVFAGASEAHEVGRSFRGDDEENFLYAAVQ